MTPSAASCSRSSLLRPHRSASTLARVLAQARRRAADADGRPVRTEGRGGDPGARLHLREHIPLVCPGRLGQLLHGADLGHEEAEHVEARLERGEVGNLRAEVGEVLAAPRLGTAGRGDGRVGERGGDLGDATGTGHP